MTQLDFPTHHRPPQLLAQLVAAWHGVSTSDLASGEVCPQVATARQDLVQILTEFTPLTVADIAKALHRPATAVAFLLRSAKTAEQLHDVTRLRLTSLRGAALALPSDISAPAAASANDIAKMVIGSGSVGAFERLALANIAAVQVLRDPQLTAEDARHAAFCLLTRPREIPATPVQVA